jgi:hypothetical protein
LLAKERHPFGQKYGRDVGAAMEVGRGGAEQRAAGSWNTRRTSEMSPVIS